MPSLSFNAIQMHYEHHLCESSEQPPLLMLSGMASDSASWLPVIPELATHHELLIPDNRCTGRTVPAPVTTSRDIMVDDLVSLLDALNIERVNVLGHSMGGMLGWALAVRIPHKVNRLICASALPVAIPARVALFETLARLRTDANEPDWFELLYQFLFSSRFFNHPAAVKQAVQSSMAYACKQGRDSFVMQANALNTFTSPLNLDLVQCPVSLVTGANDLLMTPALLQTFCAENDYPFTELPDAAHALHWEQTDAFIRYVISELDESPEC